MLAVALALVAGCEAECVGYQPPDFGDCEGGCFATMTVTDTSDPDVEPFWTCAGFPDCFTFERGWMTTRDPRTGRVNASPNLVFEGFNFFLELEPRDGGRARMCRTYWDDTTGPDPCWPWECATSGSVTLTAGGGHFRAEFSGGRTVDGSFRNP
jgi:hypothetical protein